MGRRGKRNKHKASSSSKAVDKGSHVLASSRTCKWKIWYRRQTVNTTSVEFSVGTIPGIPDTTLKMSIHECYMQQRLKLTYDCEVNEGEEKPMYVARVYSDHKGGGSTIIHESELQRNGDCCYLILLDKKMCWITIDITLDFYCNRIASNVVTNFPGDSWNDRHSLPHILDMLERGNDSDVKIISSDGKEFNAHKLILTTRNEVFDAMFRTNMEESTNGVVKLEDMSGKAVKFLLHFIYSGQTLKIFPNENKKNATFEEVLYLADKFGLTELKEYLNENNDKFCNDKKALLLSKLC